MDRVEVGERVLDGEQQRQRLQPDQPAGQLGGERLAEAFAATERDVESPGEQLRQGDAKAAVEAGHQLGVRRLLAGGVQHPCRGVPLGEQVDHQRASLARACSS